MSDKKFANTHYPGINPDPNEGRVTLDADTHARLEQQIQCIGEGAQLKLFSSSVFVLDGGALGSRVVKKLAAAAIGRVGVFGAQPLTGAHELAVKDESRALVALNKWVKAETPWVNYESFSSRSVDRQLDDMVRGFDLIVACGDESSLREALDHGNEQARTVIFAGVSGRSGWCGVSPGGALCGGCFSPPGSPEEKGLFYPTLDVVASMAAAWAVDSLIQERNSMTSPVLEVVDSGSLPWSLKRQEIRSKSDCNKCKKS